MAGEKETQEKLPLFEDFEADTLLSDTVEEVDDKKEQEEKERKEKEAEAKKAEAEKAEAKAKAEKAEKAKKEKAQKEKEEEDKKKKEAAEAKKKEEEASKGKGKDKNKEEEEKEAEDKKGKAKDKEEEEEESGKDEGVFWDDVEKLTGNPVEIDWEKEGVDPETPEGAALRESAVRQQTVAQYIEFLEQNYPKAFRALQYESKGGNIEDLYKPGEPDFSKVALDEKNEPQLESFMMSYYMDYKGFSEAKARKFVTADKDSEEGLFKSAKDALAERTKVQEKERKEREQQQEEFEKEAREQDTQMSEAVEEIVDSGDLGGFTIPVTERKEFYSFALNRIQRDGKGGYVTVSPITPKELQRTLQGMYFAYKKGDLSKIIQRAATTESTKRLKRTTEKIKDKTEELEEDTGKRNKSLPEMKDYEV